jgi:hypothetical protein
MDMNMNIFMHIHIRPYLNIHIAMSGAVDLTGLPHSDDTVTFHLTQAHEHEEMDEEEETLPIIEVAGGSEVEMPSSPPCAPDSESSLPTLPSTPCPYQHDTRLHESLRDIIMEGRTA